MDITRHYFIGNDLDELEVFEEQLEAAQIATPQIHILSKDDLRVAMHLHLHEVQSLMKQDIVRGTLRGVVVGLTLAVIVLFVAYQFDVANSPPGWMPFIFLAVMLLGFSTWEGGFIGIQTLNRKFLRFESVLNSGRHVFFVDLEAEQESVFANILQKHPGLEHAGVETHGWRWLILLQRKFGMIRHS